MRVASGTKAVARLGKLGCKQRLQNRMQRLLNQTIHHRRDAQCPYPALRLRYFHFTHRRGHVLAPPQRLSYLHPVRLEPRLQLSDREPIDSGRAFVGHHALISAQPVAAFHHDFHPPWHLRFRFSSRHRTNLCTRARSRQVPPACAAVGRTCVRFCFIGSHRGLLSYSPVSASALRGLATATMASPDFWPSFPTPLEVSALKQTARSPRLSRTHLPAYTCRIYVAAFPASTGLPRDWPAHPAAPPRSASCSSGQRFAYCFLQIPSRDGHPCRSANTSPCRVWRGLSPPSECALPGAQIQKAGTQPAFRLISEYLLLGGDRVLCGLRDAELHDGLCLDLNRLTRLRVAAHTSLAVCFHQAAEARYDEHAVLLGFLDGGVSEVLQKRRRCLVRGFELLREMTYQLGLGQACSHESSSMGQLVFAMSAILYHVSCGKVAF